MDRLLAQQPVHCFALGQLVNELVQVAYFLHQRVLDFLHPHAANPAGDEPAVWVGGRGIGEKCSIGGGLLDLGFNLFLAVSGEPAITLSTSSLVQPFLTALFTSRG